MASAVPLDNLVSWWKLDEVSGTRYDAHGLNPLATLSASPPSSIAAKWGLGQDCETSNQTVPQYAGITNAALTGLNFGNTDFTIGGWFKFENFRSGYSMYMFGKYHDSGVNWRQYLIFMSDSAKRCYFYISSDGTSGNTTNTQNSQAITTGVWYFILGWHDSVGNNIYCQINNNTPSSTAWSLGSSTGLAGDFRIGGMDRTGNTFDGVIDECFAYNRILTASERTSLYNSGNGRTYGAGVNMRNYRRSKDTGLVSAYQDQGVGVSGRYRTPSRRQRIPGLIYSP